MNKIAQFYKVSYSQYAEYGDKEQYDQIILPKRSTVGSAGYDFFMPYDLQIKSGETVTVATGIRAKIENGWVLNIYPRSSLGFKYRLTLNNTVGIIDSDYYNADNEGHIFIRFTNCGDKDVVLEKGKAFVQGVFLQFGITVDDNATENRTGGIGSTDKK